jgi:hypothetical protein
MHASCRVAVDSISTDLRISMGESDLRISTDTSGRAEIQNPGIDWAHQAELDETAGATDRAARFEYRPPVKGGLTRERIPTSSEWRVPYETHRSLVLALRLALLIANVAGAMAQETSSVEAGASEVTYTSDWELIGSNNEDPFHIAFFVS